MEVRDEQERRGGTDGSTNMANNNGHSAQAKKSGQERRLKHISRARKRNRRPRVKDGQIINRPIVEIVP